MVKIGNGFYFMYIGIAIILFFILFFMLKNKEKGTQRKVLSIILFVNLGIHLTKILFEPYFSDLPTSIRKITFENICAVSTLIFSFIYLIKKEDCILKNYMFFIGVFGGGAALFFPTEAMNKAPFIYDVIRFYICHMILVIVPLLSVIFGIIKLDYKKAWTIPLMFILIEVVILVNEVILMQIGFVDSTKTEFLDRSIRNSSFIFGPTPILDGISNIMVVLTPKFLKTDAFNLNGGVDFYFPVLWLVIPAFVYLPAVFFVMSLPFTYKDVIQDIRSRKPKEKTV